MHFSGLSVWGEARRGRVNEEKPCFRGIVEVLRKSLSSKRPNRRDSYVRRKVSKPRGEVGTSKAALGTLATRTISY